MQRYIILMNAVCARPPLLAWTMISPSIGPQMLWHLTSIVRASLTSCSIVWLRKFKWPLPSCCQIINRCFSTPTKKSSPPVHLLRRRGWVWRWPHFKNIAIVWYDRMCPRFTFILTEFAQMSALPYCL
jgi:hypothetical protein